MNIYDACENGNEEVLVNLINGSSDPLSLLTIKDQPRGRTPLHAGCAGGQVFIVSLLLGKEISVEMKSKGRNIWEKAKLKSWYTSAMLADNVLMGDAFQNSPLLIAAELPQSPTMENGNSMKYEILKLLLEAGMPVHDTKVNDGLSPLHWCCYIGDYDCIKLLIDRGAYPVDVAKGTDSKYPLDLAGCQWMMVEKRWTLISAKNERERSVSQQQVIKKQYLNIINYLISDGIACLGKEKERKRCAPVAPLSIKDSVESDIKTYWNHLLYWSAYMGNDKQVRSLLDFSKNRWESKISPYLEIHPCDRIRPLFHMNTTALHLTVTLINKHVGTSKNPLQTIFDQLYDFVETDDDTEWGKFRGFYDSFNNSPLHLAAAGSNSIAIMKLLVMKKHVIDILSKNSDGYTALEICGSVSSKRIFFALRPKLYESVVSSTNFEYAIILKNYSQQFINAVQEGLEEWSADSPSLIVRMQPATILNGVLEESIKKAKQLGYSDAKISEMEKQRLIVILVGIKEDVLRLHAEELKIMMKLKDKFKFEPYTSSRHSEFQPFLSKHKQRVVLDIIKKAIDVEKYIDAGLIASIFPIHDLINTATILKKWYLDDETETYKYPPFGEIRQYLTQGSVADDRSKNFKLDLIRNYLGDSTGMFFAWSEFYTSWLCVLIPGAGESYDQTI